MAQKDRELATICVCVCVRERERERERDRDRDRGGGLGFFEPRLCVRYLKMRLNFAQRFGRIC